MVVRAVAAKEQGGDGSGEGRHKRVEEVKKTAKVE